MELYGSIQSISGSMTASVFTGSFVGDGSGLYGISATGVTGLNLSQISTGSVIASVSQNGFNVNSDTSITGTLKVSGTIIAEQLDVTIYSSSVLFQSGSTRFGDSLDDNHTITGSVNITGSISLNGQAIGTGKLDETVFNTYTSSVNPKVSSLENASGSIRNDFNSFTSSYNTTSGSFNTRIGNLESFSSSLDVTFVSETEFGSHTSSNNTFTSSVDGRLNSLENASGSIRTDFNSYTSSNNSTNTTQNSRLNSLESTTGSLNSRLNSLESTTGSLNSFTSSIDTTIKNKLNNDGIISASFQVDLTQATNYTSFSSSIATTDLNQNNRLNSIETSTGSLNSYTSSTNGRLSSIESTTSSLNSFVSTAGGRLDSLESASGSIRSDFNFYTSSNETTNSGQNSRLTSIESTTGSLNTYTGSNNTRLGTIETTTSSLNSYTSSNNNKVSSIESTTSSLNLYTSSNNTRLNAVESTTGSLNSYTSSNNTILGIIETTTSSLNNFTSSANGRLNSLETSTGSLNSFSSSTNGRLSSIETSTSSINSFTSSINTTIKNKLNSDGVISGSVQVSLTQTTGYGTFSSSLATTDLGQDNRLSSIEGKTGSYATTGSNTFIGNQTITGSLFVSQDLIIAGSSSIQHISSSVVNIADNIITVNAQNPSIRFGGLAVIDSGSSPQVSGSMLFDSVNDQWIFVHQNQVTVTSSVLLMGPQTFNNLGGETYPTTNRVLKSVNDEHVGDSNITDTGAKVSVNSNTEITGSLIVTGDKITVNAIGGDEGGEILLGKAVTNTTLSGQGVTIDVWQNRLRFFEQGGNARGGYLDISTLANGVTTNLNVTSNVSALEITTASLNSYTSSNNTNISAIHTATSSLNSYTSSNTTNINSIHTATSSLNSFTSSASSRLSSIETSTGSLNTFTSSAGTRLSNLETSTGSLNSFTSSINTTIKNKLNSDGVVSGSGQISFGGISNVPSGLVSGSSQVSYPSLSNIPSGIVSGSSQITLSSTTGFGTYLDQAVKSGSTVTFNYVTSNRFIQTAHTTTLSNSSYNTEAAVYANAGAGANIYPGYGFHKSGELGVFLYATNRSTLRLRGDDGNDYKLWHDGNDGASSGLDSDLLDGQHGSYYATDSAVVKLTGTQTIAGEKTFSDRIIYSKPLYRSFDTFAGANDSRRTKTYTGVLVAASDISGAETYTIIDTNVPQDNFQMGGFTIEIMMNYENTNNKTKVDLAGYWNPESNGGFIGWEAHFSNPGYTPTIQIARKTSTGNVSFIITNSSPSYQIIVARDLWLGYDEQTAESTEKTWGDDWAIIQSANTTAYTNLDTVVNRSSSVSAGTGISVNTTTNAVTVTNTGTLTVAGTSNQVLINGSTAAANGNITLSLPQSIGTGSTPTFSTVTATTFTGALSGNATSSSALSGGGNLTTVPTTNQLFYTGQISSNATGLFPASDNANSIITLNRHPGAYDSQLGFSSNGNLYYRNFVNTAINTSQGWQTIWTSTSLTNLNQLTNGPGYITGISFANVSSKPTTLSGYGITDALSNDSDSEQDLGGRHLRLNHGSNRINMDPRWNESGYDANMGVFHMYSTTASGVQWGRTGIALYNGSAYQYITTKDALNNIYINNNVAIHAGNFTSYAMAGAGYSANQNLSTTSTVTFGNLRVGSGGSTNAGLVNITGANDNQVNITHDSSWGLLLGYCNEGSASGYHGPNHAAIINVRNATLHFGINNSSNVQISSGGHFHPSANNTYDCGTSSLAWRNVYTNDLHLSNMNKPEGNDVDGTNGNWTIQEGAENLYIINNNNGKKFKISLEEII